MYNTPMNKKAKNNRGFTLIELLVVVAIISLLSSIVFASLNSARKRTKDTALRQGVREFETLLHMEYNDTGSYANLQPGNWAPSASCDYLFPSANGAYATQARAICKNILTNAPSSAGAYQFVAYNRPYNVTWQKYSIMVTLNESPYLYFCVGSSGVSNQVDYRLSTINGDPVTNNPSRWSETPIGCMYNP
jgi:prepilin-type N-terminal cleavage/methylation domain-containing protein